MSDQHTEKEQELSNSQTLDFTEFRDSMNVIYDDTIADRPNFKEHAANGIENAGVSREIRKKRSRKRRIKQTVGWLTACITFFSSMYVFLVYSEIPFIEKWRTIYIETAMGTMSHHWLAEAFIPKTVIDDVMSGRTSVEEEQKGIYSSWEEKDTEQELDYTLALRPWSELQADFSTYYAEIEQSSFEKYLEEHGTEMIDKNGYLLIDEADAGDKDTGIMTTQGDQVCVVDTRNGIVIVELEDDSYSGKLAIVKCPSLVNVAAADRLGEQGDFVEDIVERNDAILGVNASGFYDPDGTGNGSEMYGMIYSEGEMLQDQNGCSMKVISLNWKDELNVSDEKPEDARDAMQFDPVLILDGDLLISGSSGWGLQPRSVIGQTQDGQILLSVVDGRQPGYSLGITIGDLSDIFYRYGAYQASNLDGGSSSIMYYDGRAITRSSSVDPEHGRYVPDAWIVRRASGIITP